MMFDNKGQFEITLKSPRRLEEITPERHEENSQRYEILWDGPVYNISGYSKANRELLLRVAHTFKVSLVDGDFKPHMFLSDRGVQRILNQFLNATVSDRAPILRFRLPLRAENSGRYRICYSMFETETAPSEFILSLNHNYDEFWCPTRWNLELFRKSGLRIPGRVIPLGVNPHIYRPMPSIGLPEMELLTTENAGRREKPCGFAFVSVFQPTPRKGLDILMSAFEKAFAGDPDTFLILGATIHSGMLRDADFGGNGVPLNRRRAKVYVLSGVFSDEDLAGIFNSCHSYVSASRGEGWNLPLTEAAACGLPVIAPRNTAHLDYLNHSNAFLFDPDGYAPIDGIERYFHWYKGQLFSYFGRQAINHLVELMRFVRTRYSEALVKAKSLSSLVRERFTWERASDAIVMRLQEVVW